MSVNDLVKCNFFGMTINEKIIFTIHNSLVINIFVLMLAELKFNSTTDIFLFTKLIFNSNWSPSYQRKSAIRVQIQSLTTTTTKKASLSLIKIEFFCIRRKKFSNILFLNHLSALSTWEN